MFIAHLPAGYLLTRKLQSHLKTNQYLWVGLVASIFPDLDLLYFYFIDHRQTDHHTYWTHLPIFWLSLWATILLVNLVLKNRTLGLVSTIFMANIFLHLILDTLAGGIAWLYPFNPTQFALVTIPNHYSFWVENFVFHWTFLVEIAIVIWAVVIGLKAQKSNHSTLVLEDK